MSDTIRICAEINVPAEQALGLQASLRDWLLAAKTAAPAGSDPVLCRQPLSQHSWAVWQHPAAPTFAAPRSPQWQAVSSKVKRLQPWCSACGSPRNLVVHHIKPYHLFPEAELDPRNLIVLCEGAPGWLAGTNCHFLWGHFGDWLLHNEIVRHLVEQYRKCLFARRGMPTQKIVFPTITSQFPEESHASTLP